MLRAVRCTIGAQASGGLELAISIGGVPLHGSPFHAWVTDDGLFLPGMLYNVLRNRRGYNALLACVGKGRHADGPESSSAGGKGTASGRVETKGGWY